MKRTLLFVLMCVCATMSAWADVSIVADGDDGVKVIVTGESYDQFKDHNFTEDEKQLLSRNKLTLDGKFSADDLTKFRDLGKTSATSLDFSKADFEESTKIIHPDWNNWQPTEVIQSCETVKYWSSCESVILSSSATSYDDEIFQGCNSLTTVVYKGMTATITKDSSTNQITATFTKSGNTTDDEFFEGVLGRINSGNRITVVANEPAAETTWDSETGTLTVSEEDGTTENLPTVVESSEYSNGADNVNKIVFADGSVWEKTTGRAGKLTVTADGDPTAYKEALETAGFTVSSEEQQFGNYVKVVNGITIITIPEDETGTVIGNLTDYSAGSGKLTRKEKEAIQSADNLKLEGEYTSNDWTYLVSGAGITSSVKTYYTYTTRQVTKTGDDGVEYTVTETVQEEHTGKYIENLDLSDAKIPDGSSGTGAAKLTNFMSHVKNVSLPTDPNYKVIPEGFATASQLSSINIPSNIEVVGKSAFANCAALTTVDFSNATNLKEFEESAFEQCNITGDLVIPASVEVIGEKAFKNSIHITSVTFPKGSQLYGEGHGIMAYAFWMDGAHNDLDNVYVLEDEHLLNCHVMAFDYDNTDGQTRMSTVKTRLHYPPSYYYYYVGEWKSRVNGGKVEGHDDLLALRTAIETGSADIVNGEDIVLSDEEKQWVNGFQKFVSSGIPVTKDTEWRTYSDVVNIRVPAYANEVADVYIVCGYEASEEVNGGRVLLKQMVEGDIIPAHTGIIIRHYVTDEQNGGVLSFPHVQTNEEASLLAENPKALDRYCFVREGDSRMTYHEDAHEFTTGIKTRLYVPSQGELQEGYENGYPNYLEFLDCKGMQRVIYNAENDNIIDWPTLEMGKKAGQKVTYRNFLFGNGIQIQKAKYEAEHGNLYDKETNPGGYRDYTDASGWDPDVHGQMGWGFFRCMSRYYKVNSKAFLHFPAEVFDKAKGGATTAIVNANVLGAKPMSLGFFADEDPFTYEIVEGGITTGIRQIDDEKQRDNEYYTVQGVKVTAPSQSGVYIHNGKKVVIK